MKNKILIFVCVLSICLSIFVFPSFAFEDGEIGDFYFADDLNFSSLSGVNDFYLSVSFLCDGVYYWSMYYRVQPGTAGRYHELYYVTNSDNEQIMVWNGTSWEDEKYRSIYIVESYQLEPEGIAFLDDNESILRYGWYYDIYDMLHNAIFDGRDLIGYQDLILSLFSFIFCLLAVSMPVIVILLLIKYVLSMRFV